MLFEKLYMIYSERSVYFLDANFCGGLCFLYLKVCFQKRPLLK